MPQDILEEKLEGCLVEGEGIKKFAYQDSLGYWTIGAGRCIDSRAGEGLSTDEIWMLLRNDIANVRRQLQIYGWYQRLDRVRKDVLVELVFNMGLPNWLKFKDTIAALEAGNYLLAASCLKQSKWAEEIQPTRVNNIIYRLKIGQYQ